MSETSIGVSKETKEKLEKLKTHPRETYEDVICRLCSKAHKMKEAYA